MTSSRKLSDQQARAVRVMRVEQHMSVSDLAFVFDLGSGAILKILNRDTYTDVPYDGEWSLSDDDQWRLDWLRKRREAKPSRYTSRFKQKE